MNEKTFFGITQGNNQLPKDMLDQACSAIANEVVDICTAFIQKTAVERAVPEMDKRLASVSSYFSFTEGWCLVCVWVVGCVRACMLSFTCTCFRLCTCLCVCFDLCACKCEGIHAPTQICTHVACLHARVRLYLYTVMSAVIVIELDTLLKLCTQEFELRKLARAESRRYCDPVCLTYQAERMPEQIRLKVSCNNNHNK